MGDAATEMTDSRNRLRLLQQMATPHLAQAAVEAPREARLVHQGRGFEPPSKRRPQLGKLREIARQPLRDGNERFWRCCNELGELQVNRRGPARKKRQAVFHHVHREIDQDVDLVGTNQLERLVVAQLRDLEKRVCRFTHALRDVVRPANVRIAIHLECAAILMEKERQVEMRQHMVAKVRRHVTHAQLAIRLRIARGGSLARSASMTLREGSGFCEDVAGAHSLVESQCVDQIAVHFARRRIELDGFPQAVDRLLDRADVFQDQAQLGVRCSVAGITLRCGAQTLERIVQAPEAP